MDSVEFLTMPQDPHIRAEVWEMPRNMWCTGPLLHVAGRRVYPLRNGDHIALPPRIAEQQGLADTAIDVFSFVPVFLASTQDEDGTVHVRMDASRQPPNGFVFRNDSDNYDRIMTACLKNLLMDLGRSASPRLSGSTKD
jgi:hypothetical protein